MVFALVTVTAKLKYKNTKISLLSNFRHSSKTASNWLIKTGSCEFFEELHNNIAESIK